MTKIFIPLPSKDNISFYLQQNFDGFLIGIEGYSENYNNLVKLEDLEDTLESIKNSNKEIFINFNRLYYNNEVDSLKEVILKISKLNITGICYTDVGVLNILKDINYDKEILWYSNHIGTNSKTINFLEKRGVSYALLSTEITLEEIINIKKNTNIKIGAFLYGYLNMATSSRKLLTNYFKYTNKDKDDNKYTIKDKVKKDEYKVVETFNTNFFTGKVLNGIKYFPTLIDNNIDFIILDDYMLNENDFYNIIEAFSSLRNAKDDEKFVNSLNEVVKSNTYVETYDGFLGKKTVYKVEDYE